MAVFTLNTLPDIKAFSTMDYVFNVTDIDKIVCYITVNAVAYEKTIQSPPDGTCSIDISRYVQEFNFVEADIISSGMASSYDIEYSVNFVAHHTGGTTTLSYTNYSIPAL